MFVWIALAGQTEAGEQVLWMCGVSVCLGAVGQRIAGRERGE